MPLIDKKKSILFDATSLRNIYTGLGQFSYYLIEEFESLPHEAIELSYLVHPAGKKHIEKFGNAMEEAGWLKRHAPRKLLPLLFPRYDLWHVIAENTRFTYFPRGTRVLLTLHGLHFLDENSPDVVRKKLARLQKLVDKSHALATVSAYTDELVRKHLNIGNRRLKIIHHGVGGQVPTGTKAPASLPKGKFIFSIGNFFERKNFHVLLPFLSLLEDYTLVLAGNYDNPYGELIRKEIQRLRLTERVLLLGVIGDMEKYWLYQNCDAFVFPSFSEGFGIPVIEAMKAGKPVFCSRFGSLPEIGDKLAYFWESFDPEHMRDLFIEKIHDFYASKENENKNREYASRFSWKKAAESYLSYYAELTE